MVDLRRSIFTRRYGWSWKVVQGARVEGASSLIRRHSKEHLACSPLTQHLDFDHGPSIHPATGRAEIQ